MKALLYVLVFIFLIAQLGCKAGDAKHEKGDVVYLNGSKVRILIVDDRLVSENRYKVRFFSFSSSPDQGLFSKGQEKVTYAGTAVVREWELSAHK